MSHFLWLFCFYLVKNLLCSSSPSFAILDSSALIFVLSPMFRSPNYAINSLLFTSPPAFNIVSSIDIKYYYCGPKMDPGLAILTHPIKAAGGNPKCFIQYKAIRDPVLPKPALQ